MSIDDTFKCDLTGPVRYPLPSPERARALTKAVQDELGEVMSDETEIVISETRTRRTTVTLWALGTRVSIVAWNRACLQRGGPITAANAWQRDPEHGFTFTMTEAAALLKALAKFGGMV